MKEKLDFIVIGAQKSGTTALFELLSDHPDIYIPPGKEATFFNDDHSFQKGIRLFFKCFYSDSSDDKLWGKVTPHYLSDPVVPDRIANTFPEVKLIVILRDPIERSLSHYRMSKRRDIEHRTFEGAISDMLSPNDLSISRELRTGRLAESKTYIAWSEYGRLLQKYFKFFKKEQILVLFSKDLEENPEEILGQIYSFLEVDNHCSDKTGKRFHEGGSRQRVKLNSLRRFTLIKLMWKTLPKKLRSRIMFWLNMFNVIKEKTDISKHSGEVIDKLNKHFAEDKVKLENLINRQVPW